MNESRPETAHPNNQSSRREQYKKLAVAAASTTIVLVIVELTIRWFFPVPTLYPRYRYSQKYGLEVFPKTVMSHSHPGLFDLKYTTNELGMRGKTIPAPHENGLKPTIVILGDSYSFGMGVADGEEYPARLAELLGESNLVVNLGTPGWGLTQEIRKYYEFGALYNPEVVVLQFCENDLEDNLNNEVTLVHDGKFRFVDSNNRFNWPKILLSKSVVQKSQFYNLVRQRIYTLTKAFTISRAENKTSGSGTASVPASAGFDKHISLLQAFGSNLKGEGVSLVMISVNGQLENHSRLVHCVEVMEKDGTLTYLDVRPWFEGVGGFESVEGHVWGKRGHAIVSRGIIRFLNGRQNDF